MTPSYRCQMHLKIGHSVWRIGVEVVAQKKILVMAQDFFFFEKIPLNRYEVVDASK